MAKQTTNSKEIRRTIRLKFLTDAGKTYAISLDYASAKLAGAEGSQLVKSVMERLLEYDIFTVKLVKALSAELIERRVIMTAMASEGESADQVIYPEAVSTARRTQTAAGGADTLKMDCEDFCSRLHVAHVFRSIGKAQHISPYPEHAQSVARRFGHHGCMLNLFFGRSPPRQPLSKRPFWQRPCL